MARSYRLRRIPLAFRNTISRFGFGGLPAVPLPAGPHRRRSTENGRFRVWAGGVLPPGTGRGGEWLPPDRVRADLLGLGREQRHVRRGKQRVRERSAIRPDGRSKAQGQGSATYPDGSHYEGGYRAGKLHGQGVHTTSVERNAGSGEIGRSGFRGRPSPRLPVPPVTWRNEAAVSARLRRLVGEPETRFRLLRRPERPVGRRSGVGRYGNGAGRARPVGRRTGGPDVAIGRVISPIRRSGALVRALPIRLRLPARRSAPRRRGRRSRGRCTGLPSSPIASLRPA